MLSSHSLSLSSASLLLIHVLLPFVSAHLEMSQPLPMRSRLDPLNSDAQIDYNLKSPLNADGSNFPCHGYQNDRPIRTTATYTAGQTYQMSVDGTIFHGGGSCQLSLSYDNGASFKVIKSMIGGCPLAQQYDFTIPSYAPSGIALFAWTWFNEIGNREMYMNCAHVQIVGSSATRRMRSKRQGQFTSFSSLPNIWRANIQGVGTCTTTEGLDITYPHVGPQVVYGGKLSSSSPVDTQTGCENDILGQTYKNLGDTSGLSANTTPPVASPISAPALQSTASTSATPGIATSRNAIGGIFVENGANSTTTSAPQINIPTASPTLLPSVNSTVPISTAIPTPIDTTPITPPVNQTFTGSASFITYASPSNTSSYLPCVPGAFLCTSQTTYLICDQAAGLTPSTPSTHFVGPMQVAAGMQCVPFLSKSLTLPGGVISLHAPAVPDGWYRSDRYVSL